VRASQMKRMVDAMRVRRGLLFWGLFLIPLGGVTLLVRAGVLDADRLVDAWRLWPLILIGIGLAVVLGRSRTAVVGTAVVALLLGALGGSALASGHLWIGALSDCAAPSGVADQHLQRSGTFAGPAAVRLALDCGSANVTTQAGSDWRVDAAYRGAAPLVDASASRLDLRVPGGPGERRNDWTVALPAASIGSVTVTANAAAVTLAFPDTHLASLDAEMNAGDLRIDLTHGAIDEIDLAMNAGRIRLDSGSSALGGDVSLNAGAFDLCVPAGVGLRFDVTDQLTFGHNLAARGLVRSGNTWTRAPSGSAAVIALSVEGSAASFSLNPDGGCR
jgi:hypothetical protein